MKTLVQTILMIVASSAAYSQDINGQWKGSLSVQGTELRIVFHVSKVKGEYKATMDSPDQKASDIPVTGINFNYPNVKIEIAAIGAMYEGALSGKIIKGKWNQAGQSFELVLSNSEEIPNGK